MSDITTDTTDVIEDATTDATDDVVTDVTPIVAPSLFTLGQDVTYVDTKGHIKVAKVIGTSDTIAQGSSLAVPAFNEAHLFVFGLNGSYVRTSVPSEQNEFGGVAYFTV